MAKTGRPSVKGKKPAHIGCIIPRELFDRLEAFRVDRMANRAAIIQRAIEQYLDREAPEKAKAKG
jgi:metal-responsive CopG/Arc/MetJ family transcriptional regulator